MHTVLPSELYYDIFLYYVVNIFRSINYNRWTHCRKLTFFKRSTDSEDAAVILGITLRLYKTICKSAYYALKRSSELQKYLDYNIIFKNRIYDILYRPRTICRFGTYNASSESGRGHYTFTDESLLLLAELLDNVNIMFVSVGVKNRPCVRGFISNKKIYIDY
jgi:hypothetical protein